VEAARGGGQASARVHAAGLPGSQERVARRLPRPRRPGELLVSLVRAVPRRVPDHAARARQVSRSRVHDPVAQRAAGGAGFRHAVPDEERLHVSPARDRRKVGRGHLRRARLPAQRPGARRGAHRIHARHHPQPARAADVRAADRGASRARAETMIPRLRAVVVVAGALVVGGCLGALAADAAAQDPVQWSAKVAAKTIRAGATLDLALTAKIDEEWHIYSVTQAAGGPVPTSVTIGAPFARAGAIRGPDPRSAYDPNFELRTETYDGTITLIVPVRAPETATASTLHAAVTYPACTERLCLPPRTVTLSVRIPVATSPQLTPAPQDGAGVIPPKRAGDAAPAKADAPPTSHLTARAFGPGAATWGGFIWLAITMGALSLLTPCVFPMVPITVSYFTRHAAPTRGRAFASGAPHGLGIVLTFTLFGSLVAAIAGAAGLNRFAASPWVNLLITALFVMFALNLFGVFELRLPVRMLSRLDGLSRRQGASVAGTLLMAMTFTITSLTCTAAFLGTLLVVAAQGEWLRPIAGLLAYSATFALPFVVLAAAPQLVSQLPRSGPWLARVKVIMGFLEIAA